MEIEMKTIANMFKKAAKWYVGMNAKTYNEKYAKYAYRFY